MLHILIKLTWIMGSQYMYHAWLSLPSASLQRVLQSASGICAGPCGYRKFPSLPFRHCTENPDRCYPVFDSDSHFAIGGGGILEAFVGKSVEAFVSKCVEAFVGKLCVRAASSGSMSNSKELRVLW